MLDYYFLRAKKLVNSIATWLNPFLVGYSVFTSIDALLESTLVDDDNGEQTSTAITLKYIACGVSAFIVSGSYLYSLFKNRHTHLYTMSGCVSELSNEIDILKSDIEAFSKLIRQFRQLDNINKGTLNNLNDSELLAFEKEIARFTSLTEKLSEQKIKLKNRYQFNLLNIAMSLLDGFSNSSIILVAYTMTHKLFYQEDLDDHEQHILLSYILTPITTIVLGIYYFLDRNQLRNNIENIHDIDRLIENVQTNIDELKTLLIHFEKTLPSLNPSSSLITDQEKLFKLFSKAGGIYKNYNLESSIEIFCNEKYANDNVATLWNLVELALNNMLDNASLNLIEIEVNAIALDQSFGSMEPDARLNTTPLPSRLQMNLMRIANIIEVLTQLALYTSGFYFFLTDTFPDLHDYPIKISGISAVAGTTTYALLQYNFNQLKNKFLPTCISVENSMNELSKEDSVLQKQLDSLEIKFNDKKEKLISSVVSIFKQKYPEKFSSKPQHFKPLYIN